MKLWNILFVILSFGANLWAQDSAIHGVVMDKTTQKPLAGVNVILPALNRGMATNEMGAFHLTDLAPGTHRIQIRCIGYNPVEKTVFLPSGENLEIIFKLEMTVINSTEEIIVQSERADTGPGYQIVSSRLNVNTPDDIGIFFRELPNISAIKKGAFCADPVIRGSTGEQLNLQVDNGIKVVGAGPNRMDPATSHMQSEDLQKIEVFTGPYSVRFGPNMSGLVNMVMQKPDNYQQFEIHSSFQGGYETNTAGRKSRFTLNGGNANMNFYLNAGVKSFGDYEDGDGNAVPGNFEARDFSFKSAYRFDAKHQLQFSARESRHKDVSFPALPMDAEQTKTHIYALDYLLQRQPAGLAAVQAKIYLANVEHLMSNLARQDRAMDAVTDTDSKNWGGRVEVKLQTRMLDQFYLGSEFYNLKMDGLRTRTGIAGTMMAGKEFTEQVWPRAQQSHLGFYLEGKKSLASKVMFSTGLRYDFDNAEGGDFDASFLAFYPETRLAADFGNFSAHVGVDLLLASGQSLSLQVGQGQRSPAIKELYINRFNIGNDGYEYLGNPQLKREQNRQVDLTYFVHRRKFNLSASLFFSRISDYISAEFAADIPPVMKTFPGVKRFINISAAERKGGEFRFDYHLTDALTIGNNLAYTHGQNKATSEPLMEIPPFEYKASAKYSFGKEHDFIRLSGRIVAKQTRISKLFNESETPGFNVWDIAAGYAIAKKISLTAGMENIFNTLYREHLNRRLKYTGMKGQYFFEPGRNIYLNLKYAF